ncbi:flagellar hook assembly protein FlgD [Arcobacter sp. LA11]|uniref:flagellar hook assembly protein FlgD n=1 Tax=Arcobacter sp. LA11 TaxID=1898176 RepID=UPI0009335DEF|nr:flagellar hook capping FlgD N-terminal domain-containing protein [Arcobacter sp. LA11]
MSTTSDITTTSSTDAYGNSYTTAVSGNDSLDNNDFITLMLTELSMQDPTEPVDSSTMLDDQLQLQTLETNISLAESMETLATSYAQTSLSSSAALIGNVIENGNLDDSGNTKQYKVSSVEGEDGTIYLSAYEITGYYDVYSFEETSSISNNLDTSVDENDSLTITDSSGDSHEISTYGKTYEEIAEELNSIDGITASMMENSNGNYQLVASVSGGASNLSQSGISLSYSSDNATAYGSEVEKIPYSNVTKIY